MPNQLSYSAIRAFDADGMPVAGAKVSFFDSGTDIPRLVYSDVGATVPHPLEIEADGNGVFPPVYVTGGVPVRAVMKNPAGVMLAGYPMDPAFMVSAGEAQASGITFQPTGSIPALNVQEAIEMVAAANIQPLADVGWGIDGNGPLILDIDATNKPSGVYRFNGTTNGTFPAGIDKAIGGIVRIERRAAGNAIMTLQSGGSTVHYVRVLDTAWTAWAQLLDASTHDAGAWNAGADANPKAISPLLLRGAILAAPVATLTANGLLSAADKAMIDNGASWVGSMRPYIGNASPSANWVICDGRELSRITHAALFALCGTAYGAGNGTTTFNIPDTRGRFPLGIGAGAGLTNRTLGVKGGAETHQLSAHEMPSHGHHYEGWTAGAGGHDHEVNARSGASGGGNYEPEPFEESGTRSTGRTSYVGDHGHLYSGDTWGAGGNGAHNNMPPFVGVNWLLRVL